MCTVTYLPKTHDSFILTSSRDEKPLRKTAELPSIHPIGNQQILFPKDPQGGGTWIAASSRGQTICLLNGAFEKHIAAAPYRKSRGLVALDAFQFNELRAFEKNYDFSGIEPFTVVAINDRLLQELRWDGKQSYIKDLDAGKPQIWSSVTLYSPAVITQRENWFEDWAKAHPELTVEDIRRFHHSGGEGDMHNGIRINRGNTMLTVSITTVYKKDHDISMIYEDLGENNIHHTNLKIRP